MHSNKNRDHSLLSTLSFNAIFFDLLPTQIKLKDRKLSNGTGIKRKATNKLSDNKHIKKGRERKQQINKLKYEIKRDKNTDRQTKTRIKKNVIKTTKH